MTTPTPSRWAQVYTFRAQDQAVHSAHRLIMFVDAILAIAATILVLNLHASTEVAAGPLATQLRAQEAGFISLLLGFLWMSGTWVLSHRQLRQLRGVDYYMTLFVIANTLVATLIPFATDLLAAGYQHRDFWVGVETVNVIILVSTFLSMLQSRYAHRRGLLLIPPRPRASGAHRPVALLIWYAVVALNVIAVIVTPWWPWVGFAIVVLTRVSALMPLVSDRKGLPGDVDLAPQH